MTEDKTIPAENTVLGFGACMIGGTPFDLGFLHLASAKLRVKKQNWNVSVQSMPMFGAVRAKKHLRRALSRHRPQIVVLQFGSTDADVSLRTVEWLKRLRGKPKLSATVRGELCFKPYSPASGAKWLAMSALSYLSRKDQGDLDGYVTALEEMAAEIIAAGAVPIVLSPFVFGQGYKTRRAQLYRDSAAARFADGTVHYLDCLSALQRYRRSDMLAHDGMHLSLHGHYVVADLIDRTICAIVGA